MTKCVLLYGRSNISEEMEICADGGAVLNLNGSREVEIEAKKWDWPGSINPLREISKPKQLGDPKTAVKQSD